MDLQIARWLHEWSGHSAWLDVLLLGAANWSLTAMGILMAIMYLLGGSERQTRKRTAILALLSSTLAVGVTHFSLAIYYRDRPYVDWPEFRNLLEVDPSSSFPSDHAVALFAAATALGAGCPRLRVVVWAMAIVTGVGRVYGGVHYPVDVMVGGAVGCTVGWVLWQSRAELFPFVDRVCGWLDGAWRTLVIGRE